MRENWDVYADNWNDNDDVIAYSHHAFEALNRFTDINDLIIMDFGCGTGLLTEQLISKATSVIAIDPSCKMTDVLKAKSLKNVTVMTSLIDDQFLQKHTELKDSFDMIVASSVCAFLPDYPATLKHLISLLKPGGLFVQWDWMPTKEDPNFGFTPDKIIKAYNKAKLTVLIAENVFSMGESPSTMQVVMGVGKR